MNTKAPRFLNDIYRDLRDRHLLVPAVALIVALIAVPVLLRKPAEVVPPAAVPAVSSNSSAVTSAVLVDDTVDVRDYRKRLAKLKSKNPFEQHFGVDQGVSGNGGGSGDQATTTDTGTELPAAPDDTGAAPAPAPTAPADTSPSPDVSGGAPTDTGSPGDTAAEPDDTKPVQPEVRFYAGRVDVTVGPIGKGKDIDNVKYLTFLPDDDAPIAAFIGLTGRGEGEGAVFALTSLAEVGKGDGRCAQQKPAPCQFLTLKPGESRYIKYEGKTYRLNVRATDIVRVPDPRGQSADSNGGTADE